MKNLIDKFWDDFWKEAQKNNTVDILHELTELKQTATNEINKIIDDED